MPKRNPAYMDGQRDAIARAAWACMLEKGLHGASVRDICERAGVSVGSFYNHFSDKTDIIVAVAEIERDARRDIPAPTSWAGYIDVFRGLSRGVKDGALSGGLRIGYEFMAELTQLSANPSGVGALMDTMLEQYRAPLASAHAAGEITLPLGLERTAELHLRLYCGTLHTLTCDHRLDPAAVTEDLIEALGLLAGLKAKETRE